MASEPHEHDFYVLDLCRDYCDVRGCKVIKRVCPPGHHHVARVRRGRERVYSDA